MGYGGPMNYHRYSGARRMKKHTSVMLKVNELLVR